MILVSRSTSPCKFNISVQIPVLPALEEYTYPPLPSQPFYDLILIHVPSLSFIDIKTLHSFVLVTLFNFHLLLASHVLTPNDRTFIQLVFNRIRTYHQHAIRLHHQRRGSARRKRVCPWQHHLPSRSWPWPGNARSMWIGGCCRCRGRRHDPTRERPLNFVHLFVYPTN